MKITVLGAGRVGSAIAADLAREEAFTVRVADRDPSRLQAIERDHGISGERVDFSLPSTVARAVGDADLVISAVPGFLGFRTLQAIIEAGVNVVDIAFFSEDPFELDELAKANGVTAIVDCGVAPGMSNLLVGHVDHLLDRTDSVTIYVGGLPVDRTGPYEYRAVFSPIDVIEEYTRPARFLVNGELVVRPALSDIELLEFPVVGTLEAFNTDGLRTLAETIDAPNMIEKTLRYPGHADKIRLLRETGFFRTDTVSLPDGAELRPLDLTTALLFPLWELKQGEEDITVMRIQVEGELSGDRTRYTYDLVDRFDRPTNTASMARTTGYTATAAARMLHAGLFDEPGIVPPEFIGRDSACVEFILAELAKRGIRYDETIEQLE
ncbi:saccharopine dehydrogenase NADP-binding domain-containing protein [Candidatus Bipolaricaulota bacterium]|nr:saccharopine dehydrogenase NADP-binding domain-containing protein [Candidatus Bipolaricaulota bacterium]